ncbi:MAG: glutamate-ammonia-ligase adenylyltransferase [Kiritimatiellae bacterium]|nr:glutamate-ammonia-ligase adenylyltransferase [Kiritimatiellia bacterium]
MKPSIEKLKSLCPDISEPVLQQHLDRLDLSYFQHFEPSAIAQHIKGLAQLSPTYPVHIITSFDPKNHTANCTLLAFDYLSEFSLITGILAGMETSIQSGEVFTYKRTKTPSHSHRQKMYRSRSHVDPEQRRKIIDHFRCRITPKQTYKYWNREIQKWLVEIITLLEKGDKPSIQKAEHRVNEHVTQKLAVLQSSDNPVLYPVDIEINNECGPFTRLRVVSQDTPAFLYTLTTVLSLHNLSIEHVEIHTQENQIEDIVDIVTTRGESIRDIHSLNKIKLAVLLTKQFTYFLDRAPDPYSALARFEQLVEEVVQLPDSQQWIASLSDPYAMQKLARVLGASDYLWEDFIRLQYETLIPLFSSHVNETSFHVKNMDTLPERLDQALGFAETYEDKRRTLNQFKNQEIFLIDLAYILDPEKNLKRLASHLTRLAENIVNTATSVVYNDLAEKYGSPKTIGGLEATYSILGLGKLGGRALGYASDIELLFVYSDNGETDGHTPLGNQKFFSDMARELSQFIETKREGIFHIDLRLRPHGHSGPMACSLESFISYYGPGGEEAHSYERLALVRMRAIGGHMELGGRLERLRNEFIYATSSIKLEELQTLRIKQFKEKRKSGSYNAKFSPGALVDLEYTVQILQVKHGKEIPTLRTPQIHQALEGLKHAGVLQQKECERLIAAYQFFRHLINGLRMLRGSAQDLFLPFVESYEFVHLARRMGYERQEELEPAQQLHVDFQTHTAIIRTFVQTHLGSKSLPAPTMGNVADLILSHTDDVGKRDKVLRASGFKDLHKATKNLRSLAGTGKRQELFVKLAILACDVLQHEPDPDMALNNWERFINRVRDVEKVYRKFLAQPKHLELMLSIFSRSQFLADSLICHPEYLEWVTNPEILHKELSKEEWGKEWNDLTPAIEQDEEWLNRLRGYRKREMLRIGVRDMCLCIPIQDIMADLSGLAETITQIALDRVWLNLQKEYKLSKETIHILADHFCIMAFGKLGGQELNYSSDIDLLGLYDNTAQPVNSSLTLAEYYAKVMEKLRADLATPMLQGHAYRVDYRLRPYGSAGLIACTFSEVKTYYIEKASLWEIQALLKLRAIAGNLSMGHALKKGLHPLLCQQRTAQEIFQSIHHMREMAIQQQSIKKGGLLDVKTGIGGIRDIEFLVQGLQFFHGHNNPDLLGGNTLNGLHALATSKILEPHITKELQDDYIFLRRIEHTLQILHDQQSHSIPEDENELEVLAKRVLGTEYNAKKFIDHLEARLTHIRTLYLKYLSVE